MAEMDQIASYFESADVFMVAIDKEGRIVDINREGCRILECGKDEVIGKDWFRSFVPKSAVERIRKVFRNMLEGNLRHMHYEHSVKTKRGKIIEFDWHNILVSDDTGKPVGILSSGTDINERKKAEKRRKETENRLQKTLDSILEGCQIIDFDWRYKYINEAAAKQGRSSKQKLIGHTMMEMYPNIENTKLFEQLKNAMTKRISIEMENEFVFTDGSKRWFELRIEPVPDGIMVLSLDITKRREMEEQVNRYSRRLEEVVAERTSECSEVNKKLATEFEELRKTEDGLMLRSMILDNAREAIFLVNQRGDFVYANTACFDVYGYTREELLSMNLRQLLQPNQASMLESHLNEIVVKGVLEHKIIHIRKDRTPIPVEVRHSLVKSPHGEFIISVISKLPRTILGPE